MSKVATKKPKTAVRDAVAQMVRLQFSAYLYLIKEYYHEIVEGNVNE